MRSYKAARRAAKKKPVEFEVTYDKPTHHTDDTGAVVGTTFAETTEHFTCRGEIPSLLLSELAAQADLDAASAEGVALLRAVFAAAFADDAEYSRFFKIASKYLDDDETFDIMAGLVEDFAGRPTVRPSDSPATPSETTEYGEISRVVSFQRGEVQVLPAVTPEQRQAAHQEPPAVSSG